MTDAAAVLDPASAQALLARTGVPDPADAPALRWGVLAPGGIAHKFVDAVHSYTAGRVVAAASRDADRARAFAQVHGIPRAYAGYDRLVADPEVDAVYVASPHSAHLAHAVLAIEAGKHVLVEKPVGLTAAEARRIDEAARAAGVFCMEALWSLFLPKYDVIRQILDEGVLGEVHTVLADMGEWFDPDHRILRADLGGGPLLDLGTYPVTLATWVLGRPDAVAAAGTAAPSGVNGQLAASLRWGERATAQLFCSVLTDTPNTATIAGTRARITMDRFFYRPGGFELYGRTDGGDRFTGTALRWDEEPIDHQALHFEAAEVARRITAGETGSPLRPFADTIATLEVMDAIRERVGFDFAAAETARG